MGTAALHLHPPNDSQLCGCGTTTLAATLAQRCW
eukprot:CAMPEP_0178402044 /NCGR_PEP_ID=MMETSP0689_2-20121128/16633_1 /TAXON_ID=160604 /ORGANISM="Amphidinium massartii, Strain CS-259" /LENGTH=33 /DNA_ID= /DNA_START= /DNA_END= /DNA_ORIENTATION=